MSTQPQPTMTNEQSLGLPRISGDNSESRMRHRQEDSSDSRPMKENQDLGKSPTGVFARPRSSIHSTALALGGLPQ